MSGYGYDDTDRMEKAIADLERQLFEAREHRDSQQRLAIAATQRAERAEAALAWYGERAESINLYLAKQQSDAVMAVVTELSLDGGARVAAIRAAKERE